MSLDSNTIPSQITGRVRRNRRIQSFPIFASEEEVVSQADDAVPDDAPEQLVRTEDRCVRSLSFTFLSLLIFVSVVTTLCIYIFTSSIEKETFLNDYRAVATNLKEKFKFDVAQRFFLAQGLAITILRALEDRRGENTTTAPTTARSLYFDSEWWEQATRVPRLAGACFQIAWNPLLRDESEQDALERSVLQTEEQPRTTHPPCFLCHNDPTQGYVNRDQLVPSRPGRPDKTCGEVDDDGRSGVFLPQACPNIRNRHNATCECGPVPKEAAVPVNPTYDLKPPTRLFGLKLNRTGDDMYYAVDVSSLPYPLLAVRQMETPGLYVTPPLWIQNTLPHRDRAITQMLQFHRPVLTPVVIRRGPYYEEFGGFTNQPSSILYYPVTLKDPSHTIVGAVSLEVRWDRFLTNALPPHSEYVDVVVESSCQTEADNDEHSVYTFGVNAESTGLTDRGPGDHHDRRFDAHVYSTEFIDFYASAYQARPRFGGNDPVSNVTDDPFAYGTRMRSEPDYCNLRFHIYPTNRMEDLYITRSPIVLAAVAGAIFLFTSILFKAYDFVVKYRQNKVMETAKRTNDIVVSLFPQNVRERLYERARKNVSLQIEDEDEDLASLLSGDEQDPWAHRSSELIADFFPHTIWQVSQVRAVELGDLSSVLWSHLVVTSNNAVSPAWSSEREPWHVFKLLETIYESFDDLANKMGVFKVETIGDCYVAVCGLPKPNERHAIVMAKFAHACLCKVNCLTKELVRSLGPSTSDIRARAGLHTGPVIAGVLRGDRARFQLFGDTVNTCSRLESSSKPFCIHASKTTADLLELAGKGLWITPRVDRISLKGKGEMETFWLHPSTRFRGICCIDEYNDNNVERNDQQTRQTIESRKTEAQEEMKLRLVDWNVDTMLAMLKNVVRCRERNSPRSVTEATSLSLSEHETLSNGSGCIFLDAVQGMDIPMVKDEPKVITHLTVSSARTLRQELWEYVADIANNYRDVPFHNFEHASHVVMSAWKFVRRITSTANKDVTESLNDETYGISTDPLVQFSVVFAALIHDVQHTGLTNAELIEQGNPVAKKYQYKSVAEQNSMDTAWRILFTQGRFETLRSCLFSSLEETIRFRQLLQTAILATDIADKRLIEGREYRWNEAFSTARDSEQPDELVVRRRATIVFEYIIQAADVSHAMQHFHTYRKFNARLFEERYVAWVNNSSSNSRNPADGWYEGELMFFDTYIIPLAQKLKVCGAFGVSHDECLNYASENREEWKREGRKIVALMFEECQKRYANGGSERYETPTPPRTPRWKNHETTKKTT